MLRAILAVFCACNLIGTWFDDGMRQKEACWRVDKNLCRLLYTCQIMLWDYMPDGFLHIHDLIGIMVCSRWNVDRKTLFDKKHCGGSMNHKEKFFMFAMLPRHCFNIVEAPLKKSLNFDVCVVWLCSDGPINSQEYNNFEIYVVTIKISMTEYLHWINGQAYHLF